MNKESRELHVLRTLILKSQSELLSDEEIVQLNTFVQSEDGSEEAAAILDQICALTDSGSIDAVPMADVLAEAFGGSVQFETTPNRTAGREDLIHSEAAVASNERAVISTGVSQPSTRGPWILAIVASHLLFGSLVWSLSRRSDPAPTESASIEETAPINLPSAAQLVSMTACVWRSSGSSPPTLGETIETGEVLSLIEGIAELKVGETTPSEAVVRIEGPASVFVRADGQLGVQYGSLTAKSLGTGSSNLVVHTPIGEVLVEGQSAIGLVFNGSVDEVHVFSGQVMVQPIETMSTSSAIRLEKGEAVRFSSEPGENYGAVLFEASMSSFVSARSSGFDPLEIGNEYVRKVLESKPCVYWRFEKLSSDFPYRVENEGSAPGMDAIVIGESGWRRYGTNRVAELGKIGSTSAFRSSGIWPPEPLPEYTIEMWVKPELYHHGEAFCMHAPAAKKDGRYSHSLMLETLARHWRNPLEKLPPNRFRFVHRAPASGEVTEGSNLTAGKPYQVRTWQHLVAQKRGETVSLWLDGRISSEQFEPKDLVPGMQVVLGQLYISRSERRFVGQLDEIALYDRCLSQQELRGHIRAAGRSVAPAE